jgi:hypothetical protein
VNNKDLKNLETPGSKAYLQCTNCTNFGNKMNARRGGNPSKDGSNSRKHRIREYVGASWHRNDV